MQGLLLLLLCPPSENGEQECVMGPGVCRPVICLPVLLCLWLKKLQVIILLLLLFSRGPVSSLLFSPSERERQREADTEWEADCGFQRQGAGCTGVERREERRGEERGVGKLSVIFWLFCGREGMSIIGSVMRRGTERHQISDPDSWEWREVQREREREEEVGERESERGGKERGPCEKGVEGSWDLVLCWMKQPPTN